MYEKMPRLPDKHLGRAREIVAEKLTKQKCKVCYDRGYIGTNQDNMLVPCSKFVDVEGVAGLCGRDTGVEGVVWGLF